jgi:hypothetical protein
VGPFTVIHQLGRPARVDTDKLAFGQVADLLHQSPESRQVDGGQIKPFGIGGQPLDPPDDFRRLPGILMIDGDDRGKLAAP